MSRVSRSLECRSCASRTVSLCLPRAQGQGCSGWEISSISAEPELLGPRSEIYKLSSKSHRAVAVPIMDTVVLNAQW